MRPHESGFGAILESPHEVKTLAEAADVTSRLFELGADEGIESASLRGYAELLRTLRDGLQTKAELSHDSSKPYAFLLDQTTTTEFLPVMLRVAAEQHPDPDVRESAANMTRSYENHIYGIAMLPPLETTEDPDER